MTTRRRSKVDGLDPQQHLRYAEVYEIDAPQDVEDATNAEPIEITITGHGYATGDKIKIEGVEGNTAANGCWTITVLDSDTFELEGSEGNGAYTEGGTANYQQPVRVKLLKWDSTTPCGGFTPFGADFRIGEYEDADTVNSADRIWITYRRDARRWVIAAGASSEVHVVAITTAIAAPTWDPETRKRTPTSVTAYLWIPHEDGDGTETLDEERTITFKSHLKVTVDAPATGKFKAGLVSDGKLLQVQCDEEDLPEDWDP